MAITRTIPPYAELPLIEKLGDRHAWDVWGRDDQLGAINLLTPERVLAAAALVHKGRVFSLNLPLNQPCPPLAERDTYVHHMHVGRGGRDDHLDNFYLQCSSQWDALRHIRAREFGYWGGRQDEEVDAGALGIERWAEHGITGRGVLIDVPGYMERTGRPYDVRARFEIDGALIEQVAASQDVTLQPADVLVLRTGWLAWYFGQDQASRDRLQGSLHTGEGGLDCPGLDPHRETAAWLWDHQIPAIAADNPALEALRIDPVAGFQHRRLIALLGMALGELWFLEDLGRDCAEDGIYEFMLVGGPLNLSGGVGSPANAYAIK